VSVKSISLSILEYLKFKNSTTIIIFMILYLLTFHLILKNVKNVHIECLKLSIFLIKSFLQICGKFEYFEYFV
jgi:hypothetical protein